MYAIRRATARRSGGQRGRDRSSASAAATSTPQRPSLRARLHRHTNGPCTRSPRETGSSPGASSTGGYVYASPAVEPRQAAGRRSASAPTTAPSTRWTPDGRGRWSRASAARSRARRRSSATSSSSPRSGRRARGRSTPAAERSSGRHVAAPSTPLSATDARIYFNGYSSLFGLDPKGMRFAAAPAQSAEAAKRKRIADHARAVRAAIASPQGCPPSRISARAVPTDPTPAASPSRTPAGTRLLRLLGLGRARALAPSALAPDGDPGGREVCVRLGDRVLAVVEDRRRQRRVGAAPRALRPGARASPAPPEAITGTSTALARRRASARGRSRPRCRRDPCSSAGSRPRRARAPSRAQATTSRPVARAAAGDEDLPAGRRLATPPGVDREHDALGAEHVGELVDQLRPRDRGAVDRDLVGAGVEHRLGVGDAADAAADRERDEDVVGGPPCELDDRVARSCVAVMSRNTSSSAPSAS